MAPSSEFPETENSITIRSADAKVVGQLEHIQRQLMQISARYSGPWVAQVDTATEAAGRAATAANGTLDARSASNESEGGDLESDVEDREEEF